jgi:CubicO group peptidase (beta-lactamase class C family)
VNWSGADSAASEMPPRHPADGRLCPVLGTARDVISSLMSRHHVPGLSLAVTDTERVLFAEGFGSADLAAGRPATPETRYLWFSMSKIATATAAMTLVDTGRLDLDEPVDSAIRGFRSRRGDRAVVRELLNHTAGAGNPLPLRWVLPADASSDGAREAAAAILARHGRPRRPPGGPARYSNIGYLALAQVIERASGQRFEDFVRRAVLEPAGMSSTGYAVPIGGDLATGYVRMPRPLAPLLRVVVPASIVGERRGDQVALRPFRVAGAGYGGLIGPVGDAARLLRLHLADGEIDGNRVLAAGTTRAMRRIDTPGKPFDLGLGWFRRAADRDATPPFVEHWGTGGGFWNAMRLYPDLGLGIVVMANTTRAYDHSALMGAVIRSLTR